MKKILLITVATISLTIGLTSCNMDLRPPGVIETENGFQSADDAAKLREGMYVAFRGVQGGAIASYPDYMSDLFHATTSFGNRGNVYYNWQWTASDSDMTSVWAGLYSYLKDVNYYIERAPIAMESMSDENKAIVSVYLGEAYFFRAYYHYMIVDKYSKCYAQSSDVNADYGIPYMTSYNATSDATKYPHRGSLENTYTQILADLASAEELLTTPGSKASTRLTVDALKAFKARIALNMGNYDEVIANAKPLIDEGKYALVSDSTLFANIWLSDNGEETIMQLPASFSAGEGGTSYMYYSYISYNAQKDIYTPDYLPTVKLLDLYEPNDLRYQIHYKPVTVTLGGNATFDVIILYKYVGNPELKDPNTIGNSEVNKAKPFRISEQYLNLAEAYARNGDDVNAKKYLNELRTSRGASEYTGGNVLEEIFNERTRELIGEGFLLSDLKRFNKGVSRGAAQNPEALFLPDLNTDFEILAGNDRFVWPIPAEELDSNPQIRGEQNPGY